MHLKIMIPLFGGREVLSQFSARFVIVSARFRHGIVRGVDSGFVGRAKWMRTRKDTG